MNSTATVTEIVMFSPTTSCVQCNATMPALDAMGITYRVVKVADDDTESRDQLRELGFQQFPILKTPIGNWSGFRPDKINQLIAAG